MISTISKAVIPVAGLGTRLLSATKEQPKEMLPIFVMAGNHALGLKPLVQVIFEQIFDLGIRNFCFVVGKRKRAIEDHFTSDYSYLHMLNDRGGTGYVDELDGFYKRINLSAISWINQPEPNGFGDAIAQTKHIVRGEDFLVHAGDTLVRSNTQSTIVRLVQSHTNSGSEATLVLKTLQDPRSHGIAEVLNSSEEILKVTKVIEKPSHPTSRLAIMPLYAFTSRIFDALQSTRPDERGEIQLTDAIQNLIEGGHRVQAIKLYNDDIRLDIGTPETYWEALILSYNCSIRMMRQGQVK